jgi:hypothetical protein
MGWEGRGRAVAAVIAVAIVAVGCTAAPSPGPSGATPPAGEFPNPAPTAPAVWSHLEQKQLLMGGIFGGDGNPFIFDAEAYGDGFVAVGESFRSDAEVTARIWTSANGIEWLVVDDPAAELDDAQVDSVATDGHLLLAFGSVRGAAGRGQGRVVWSSTDARTWRRLAAAPQRLGDFGVAGIAGQHGSFIAWGGSPDGAARLMRTTDGVDWTAIDSDTFSDGLVLGVAPYRGGWLAVGSRRPPATTAPGGRSQPALAWWSADGTTWLRADVGGGPSLGTALPGAGGVLGVGASECGSCVAAANLWHADGRTWQLLGPDRLMWPTYATDGSRIVAWDYQGAGTFAWSTDGIAWQPFGEPFKDDRSNGVIVVGTHGLLMPFGTQDEPIDAGVLYLEAG